MFNTCRRIEDVETFVQGGRSSGGIITSEEELLLDLKLEGVIGNKKTEEEKIFLEKEELLVYSVLDLQPKSLDDIYNRVELPRQDVMRVLMTLKKKGIVEECFMNYYKKIN